MDLNEVVGEYILAKIDLTECMQKHFRQLCNKCPKYLLCEKYNNYVEVWIRLQKVYLGDPK